MGFRDVCSKVAINKKKKTERETFIEVQLTYQSAHVQSVQFDKRQERGEAEEEAEELWSGAHEF